PKRDSMILGNSASPYNNHLEAIRLLERLNYKGKLFVPFSYGRKKRYVKYIKQICSRSSLDITLFEDFVNGEEYIQKLNGFKLAVFPSYRQMGLGNIFISVRCGMKIYLSQRNPTFNWLIGEGFHIYSIERNLEED